MSSVTSHHPDLFDPTNLVNSFRTPQKGRGSRGRTPSFFGFPDLSSIRGSSEHRCESVDIDRNCGFFLGGGGEQIPKNERNSFQHKLLEVWGSFKGMFLSGYGKKNS